MKYAHLADLHLGSWKEEKMRELSTKVFLTTIDKCIEQQVDFILLSGDLFNTSLPSLDTLKIVTKKLKELQECNIPLYTIAGSHDFSPSGKTMLDVLENAGLLINVCKGFVDEERHQLHLKFTLDKKTGAKITGILGKRGQLDKVYYQNLSLEDLERESGYKIFLFHTTLTELKPKSMEKMESQPVSFLPKNFNYYAGGHVHHPSKLELEHYGMLTYPGALFPNNFAELEEWGLGGYYVIEAEEKEQNKFQQKVNWIPIELKKHQKINLNCAHKSAAEVYIEIIAAINNIEANDALVTLRISGTLRDGKVSDIDFKAVFEKLYSQNAYFVMRNTAGLESEEFEEIKSAYLNAENAEEEIIKEHLQQLKLFDKESELHLTQSLLAALNTSKKEGETVADFNCRIEGETSKILNL